MENIRGSRRSVGYIIQQGTYSMLWHFSVAGLTSAYLEPRIPHPSFVHTQNILMPQLTWAGPLDTVSVGRSRPQPRPWSRCRHRTASLSCPTRPDWAWPRFCSAERVPTLLVNPPIGWANTTDSTVQPTHLILLPHTNTMPTNIKF